MRESHDAFGSPCFVDGPDRAVYSGGLEPTLQLSYTVMLPYRKPLPVLGNSSAVLPLPASILTKNAALGIQCSGVLPKLKFQPSYKQFILSPKHFGRNWQYLCTAIKCVLKYVKICKFETFNEYAVSKRCQNVPITNNFFLEGGRNIPRIWRFVVGISRSHKIRHKHSPLKEWIRLSEYIVKDDVWYVLVTDRVVRETGFDVVYTTHHPTMCI